MAPGSNLRASPLSPATVAPGKTSVFVNFGKEKASKNEH